LWFSRQEREAPHGSPLSSPVCACVATCERRVHARTLNPAAGVVWWGVIYSGHNAAGDG